MKNKPVSFLAAQALILVQAGFWLVYSLYAVLGMLPGSLAEGTGRWLMAALAFGVAGLLACLVLYLQSRRRAAYFGGLVILALIGFLSITDEAGLLDWISLITSLGAFALLISAGSWYLDPVKMEEEQNGA